MRSKILKRTSLINSLIKNFILKDDLCVVLCAHMCSGIVTFGEEVGLKDNIHFIQLKIHCVGGSLHTLIPPHCVAVLVLHFFLYPWT